MATNSMLTPMNTKVKAKAKAKGKKAPHDVMPKDEAFDRNYTKEGKPKLNAVSNGRTGEGAMGQRR